MIDGAKKYMFKERILWEDKAVSECHLAVDRDGKVVPFVIKPFDTLYGIVKGDMIMLYFNGQYTGMFYSMADYWEEVEDKEDKEEEIEK